MIEPFLDHLRYEKRVSGHTITAYASDLDQFGKYLLFQYELDKPEQATPPMLRSWVVSLVEEGMNPTSVNRKMATIRSYFKFLRKKNHILKDPTTNLTSLKARRKLPAFVEEKAMDLLFDNVEFPEGFEGLRDRILLELLYGTGMRLSELIALEVGQVDTDSRIVRVFGKRSKERLIPITASLAHLLTDYISQRAPVEDTPVLLLTDSGKAVYPVFVQRLVKKYLSAVTTLQQKSPHVLRHTYATHLLNRGADLNAIKELLGHANLAATQIYTHNSIEKLKKTHQQAHPKA
ncbi:tyrosine-type recombinase/integrase [Telluribacter humicola]|uniref:tyrosine-type recombinase/integrase n=1 Tax=Telluribacter humicola TaxID=1720261 RepID=UPI001A963BBF|nr:tyrosine-type recombinase/integrase [Telluribacter humicola]